jgi:hypothetical protein
MWAVVKSINIGAGAWIFMKKLLGEFKKIVIAACTILQVKSV